MEEIQRRRDSIVIPNGKPLHRYANLYFDFRNPMLYKRKDERDNICILKFSLAVLDLDGVIVSDSNASSSYACFYLPEDGFNAIDFDIVFSHDWRDENPYEYFRKKSVKCAEVLVPGRIDYGYLQCVAVHSHEARQKILEMGFDKPVRVEPDCFF